MSLLSISSIRADMVHSQLPNLLIWTVIAFMPARPLHGCSTDLAAHCGDVFLTKSAVSSYLEVNWRYICDDHPNKIKIYEGDPLTNETRLLLTQSTKTKIGTHGTSIAIDNLLPAEWQRNTNPISPTRGPTCVKYWIASYRDERLVQKNCLQINPTWMENNGNVIDDIPLSRLCLPGTHNSGCFDNGLRFESVNKFIITQDTDVWTQMVYGIRYLDLRIGYYKGTTVEEQFWVNHDVFRVARLVTILREIKEFLTRTTREIIIMDIHRFPVGFNTYERIRHEQLVDLIFKEVGDLAVPRSYQTSTGPTLRELWRQKRRLIICYGRVLPSSIDSSWLWSTLTQKWGNQQTVSGLKSYLHNLRIETKGSNPLWAQMAELTPTAINVFFGLIANDKSLAHLADEVNSNVTIWYMDEITVEPNIIATDFFLGNNIINVCIRKNLKKGLMNKLA